MNEPVKGQIWVPCKPANNADPLLKVGQSISVAASNTTNITKYTIPTGRGEVKAIDIFVGSATVADIAQLFLTLLVNGNQIFQDDSMLAYTSLFQNSKKPMVITLPEASVITGSIVNGSASVIPVTITYYFYNPYLN